MSFHDLKRVNDFVMAIGGGVSGRKYFNRAGCLTADELSLPHHFVAIVSCHHK